ncbi:21154_t:CDS:2 [Entrophospora sp. SA101]|nr:10877_t:CDS:2 [Entrophospora candida]CAJ0904511.1 21145_t:CDS:2 [Entrophospora sp. SA101]CAJ0904555.1 21154_t:CDS:2 [Entrophospora sp. SA101]
MTDYIGYSYALTVTLGGVVGYVKAGSLPSLIAANRVSTNPKNVGMALIVSCVLLIVMGVRFYNSGKFMPAGLVSILSLLSAARYTYRYIS